MEEVQSILKAYEAIQIEMARLIEKRKKLDAQLRENQLVQGELSTYQRPKVFKLVGPVLVGQAAPDALANVNKRIEWISGEVKRLDGLLDGLIQKKGGMERQLLQIQQQQQQQQQVK